MFLSCKCCNIWQQDGTFTAGQLQSCLFRRLFHNSNSELHNCFCYHSEKLTFCAAVATLAINYLCSSCVILSSTFSNILRHPKHAQIFKSLRLISRLSHKAIWQPILREQSPSRRQNETFEIAFSSKRPQSHLEIGSLRPVADVWTFFWNAAKNVIFTPIE